MRNKVKHSDYKTTVSNLVYDYIDFGNAFSTTEWVNDSKVDEATGETIPGYVGPRIVRISPYDIVFNPLAATFKDTPKIIRSVKTIGELKVEALEMPTGDAKDLFNYALGASSMARSTVSEMSPGDLAKSTQMTFDGFSDIKQYMDSDYVEILTFYGDLYDAESDKLYKNHIISVIDKSFVLSAKQNPSWLGNNSIRHAGWRLRQDSLYAMGPLDNLVGMQYRIDHLENLKADVFDLIAHPVLKVRGDPQDFTWGPGEKIWVGDDGDVSMIVPDTTALNADTQIARLSDQMEELAGAPKQAMGVRTPGEKTAFEVQTLDNATNRIYVNKTKYFESMIIETSLNDMLELARRNMDVADVIRVLDETGAILFKEISKEDISAKGSLQPKGASHFERKATMMQNLTTLSNSAIGQDPAVNRHISGFRTAELVQELLGLEKQTLVEKNVRIGEEAEATREAQSTQQAIEEEGQIEVGI